MTSLCATKQELVSRRRQPSIVTWSSATREKEKDGSDPPHKKRRIFLKSHKNCHFQYRSKEEMETILKGYVPQNTEKNTRWARKCFTDWLSERNRVSDENDKCPESILEVQSPEVLNNCLPQIHGRSPPKRWRTIYTQEHPPNPFRIT